MTLHAIRARHKAYAERAPAPVITRKLADQMHADITELLERLASKT